MKCTPIGARIFEAADVTDSSLAITDKATVTFTAGSPTRMAVNSGDGQTAPCGPERRIWDGDSRRFENGPVGHDPCLRPVPRAWLRSVAERAVGRPRRCRSSPDFSAVAVNAEEQPAAPLERPGQVAPRG